MGKEWREISLSNLYKRIWRRTALLNGARVADTYALDPDPLGCWHLWSLLTLCLVLDFCAAKVSQLQHMQNFYIFFFFFWSCCSSSLYRDEQLQIIILLKISVSLLPFSFFFTPSLSLATHQRTNGSNSPLVSKIIAYNLNKSTIQKNAI